jgi:ribosomal protein L7/L12
MSTLDQQDIAALRMRINKLEAQIEYLYKHLEITFVEDTRLTDDPQVIAALRANNIIEAIKYYRESTGVGLADAKSAVEEMRKRLGI